MQLIKYSRDRNGNATIKIKLDKDKRAFSIQTNGNLPFTHYSRMSCNAILKDLDNYNLNLIRKEIILFLRKKY